MMWIEAMNRFEIQCITEGLQLDKAGISTKIQSQWIEQMILCKNWHDSSLQVSIKHFMCTLLDGIVLVMNVGQKR